MARPGDFARYIATMDTSFYTDWAPGQNRAEGPTLGVPRFSSSLELDPNFNLRQSVWRGVMTGTPVRTRAEAMAARIPSVLDLNPNRPKGRSESQMVIDQRTFEWQQGWVGRGIWSRLPGPGDVVPPWANRWNAPEFAAVPSTPMQIRADQMDYLRAVDLRRLSAGAAAEPNSLGTIRSNMVDIFTAMGDGLQLEAGLERLRTIAANDGANPVERAKLLVEAMKIADQFGVKNPLRDVQRGSFPEQMKSLLNSVYRSDAWRGEGGIRQERRLGSYTNYKGETRRIRGTYGLLDFLGGEFIEAAKLSGFWDPKDPELGLSRMSNLFSGTLFEALNAIVANNKGVTMEQALARVGRTLKYSTKDQLKEIGTFLDDHAESPEYALSVIGANNNEFNKLFKPDRMSKLLSEDFLRRDLRLDNILEQELATAAVKQEGYMALALRSMRERDPAAAHKLENLIEALQRGERVDMSKAEIDLIRKYLPGLTRQQGFDVAASEAAGAMRSRLSRVRDPETWLMDSLKGTSPEAFEHAEATPWHLGILREVEQAVASRRRRAVGKSQRPNLDPASLREEAMAEIRRLSGAEVYSGDIARFIANNQANREARWMMAFKNQTPAYIPGLGVSTVTGLSTIEGGQTVAQVTRINHDPRSVFVSANARGWQAALELMGKGRGGGGALTDLLHQVGAREHLGPVRQSVVPLGDNAGTLVRLDPSYGRIGLQDEAIFRVSDQLMRAWAPWFVGKEDTPDRLFRGAATSEEYRTGINSMYLALQDVLGPQMDNQVPVQTFEDLANANYRRLIGRFHEEAERGGITFDGFSPKTIELIDRIASAGMKTDVDLKRGAATDRALVHKLWTEAKQTNDELKHIKLDDFQRAIEIVRQGKYGVRSLDYEINEDGDSLSELIADPNLSTRPEEAYLAKEAAEEAAADIAAGRQRLSRSQKSAYNRYREYIRGLDGNDPLSPHQALSEIMKEFDAEGVAHVLRKSKRARLAFGEVMAARGEIQISSLRAPAGLDPDMLREHAWENLRILSRAAGMSPDDFTFSVREGGREDGRVMAAGLPEITEDGIRIGDRVFMNRDQIAMNTIDVMTEDNHIELRSQHGYAVSSSRTSGLGEGEMPMVKLPGFDRGTLSGRAYRAGIDADATFINARRLARGAKGVTLDLEFFDLDQYADLAHLSQNLQIAYEGNGTEVVANIAPSADLDAFIRGRLDLYKKVARDGIVEARDIAMALTEGKPDGLVIQRERDIMNAISFVAKLNPDAEVRQLSQGLYETEFIGNRELIHGVRNVSNLESLVVGALEHLTATSTDEKQALRNLAGFVGSDGIILGQNVSVADLPKILAAGERYNSGAIKRLGKSPAVNLDVLARYLYPEGINGVSSWSLAQQVTLLPADDPLRIEYETSAHTGPTDVRLTKRLFGIMEERARALGMPLDQLETYSVDQASFATMGIRDYQLPAGVYTFRGMGEAGDSYRAQLVDQNGKVFSAVASSGSELKADLAQYGDLTATPEEAVARLEELRRQRSNATLSDAFDRGFYHLDRLIDAASGGSRRERTARLLTELPEGRLPLDDSPMRHLLSLSGQSVESMLGQQYTDRQILAGQSLAGNMADGVMSPGLRAVMDAYTEVEAVGRGMRHLPLRPDQHRSLAAESLRALNEALKDEAGVRTMEGRYSLGQLELENGSVGLYLDTFNPPRSMYENVQAVANMLPMDTETQRKHEALKLMHNFFEGRGMVGPLAEGESPSLQSMSMQIASLPLNEKARQVDYTGLLQSLPNLSADDAATLRNRLVGAVRATQAAEMVDADGMAREQTAAFGQAMRDISGEGGRVPLPYGAVLPLNGPSYDAPVSSRVDPAIVARIETLAAQTSTMEMKRAALERRMEHRPELAQEYGALGRQVRESRKEMDDLLRVARDRSSDPLMASLLGLDNPGEDTMVLMGDARYRGRRVGDLYAADLPFAIDAVENSPVRNTQLRDRVAGALRSVNERIKEMGAEGHLRVTDILNAAPAAIGEPVNRGIIPPPTSQQGQVRQMAQEIADAYDTRTAAREALREGSLVSAPVTANALEEAVQTAVSGTEYNFEKHVSDLFKNMKESYRPGYGMALAGGAVLLGALTLGGRGGYERPRGNEAPAPDGSYQDGVDEMASRPLSPEITMGNQAYLEPNGMGMTVKLRTRGAHDPGQITAMVQDALAGQRGRLNVTVRDDREKIDRTWIADQVRSML